MPPRTSPRISVNKLGEYLLANPVRRRRIISDQKYPADFIVARYRDAVDPIVRFLSSDSRDEQIISEAIDRLASRPVATDWQDQDRALSIEALESFLSCADQLPADGVAYSAGDADPERLTFAGVEVSVRPELLLTRSTPNGAQVGAFKIYVVKSFALTDDSAPYIGAVLQQFATDHLTPRGMPDYRLCGVLDVFTGRVFMAPRAYRNRLSHVEAACEEIARAWPTA